MKAKNYFFIIISIFLIVDIAILLDIPFLRQILGFLFLTILPGLLILQILKLDKIGSTEKIVLSVGLSISFLMLFGLLINNLSVSLGYLAPLSTISLLISFNIAFIVLTIIGYKTKTFEKSFTKNYLPNFSLNTSEKAFLIIPVFFPALSIFGMHVMNTTDNNIILMFLLFLISIYVTFVCFLNQKFPKKMYPIVIFLISISLLLLISLRSNHIIGVDTHVEYYLFQTTFEDLHWHALRYGNQLDACLSISILPTIYQSILNMPSEIIFKILYSLIYSVSPLVIYIISKKYVGEMYAFLASCFFMFQWNFLFTAYNTRTNTAILFFALAMMTLFSDKLDPLKKRILLIVFMASCMVSHYSTTYIFFFIMLGTFVGTEILSKKYTFKKVISLTIVILFFSMIFFWYSQVTEAAFNAGVGFIEKTFKNLHEFFILESRGGSGEALLGEGIWQKGIPHKIEFVFTWLTFVFIGIGIITLIRGYKKMSFPELNFKKPEFLKEKFEVTYFMIALACSGLLVVMIALPFIAVGYNLDRLYTVTITILSVFFVIGGITLSKHFFFLQKTLLLRKSLYGKNASQAKRKLCFFGKVLFSKETFMTRGDTHDHKNNKVFSYQRFEGENGSEIRAYLVILLVLIPYFLCVTGVMYNLFGVPRAIILNSEGEQYDLYYVHDQESYGAKWLKEYNRDKTRIYTTDIYVGKLRLMSQGNIPTSLIDHWSLANNRPCEDYIYLGYYNVVDGKLFGAKRVSYNLSDYSHQFVGKNKIYANGGSEAYG